MIFYIIWYNKICIFVTVLVVRDKLFVVWTIILEVYIIGIG